MTTFMQWSLVLPMVLLSSRRVAKSPHILKKIEWRRSHRPAESRSLAEIDVREDGGARAYSQIGRERGRQAEPFHFVSIPCPLARLTHACACLIPSIDRTLCTCCANLATADNVPFSTEALATTLTDQLAGESQEVYCARVKANEKALRVLAKSKLR